MKKIAKIKIAFKATKNWSKFTNMLVFVEISIKLEFYSSLNEYNSHKTAEIF